MKGCDMKHLLLICLLLLPVLRAETVTVEIELPENPGKTEGGDFSPEYLRETMEVVADRIESYMNRRATRLYLGDPDAAPPLLGACGNWKTNYDGNGICDDLPLPPLRTRVTTEYNGLGWGLVLKPATEPLTPLCQFDDSWLARLSTSCRAKLGLGAIPPAPGGVIHVGECWWNGRCRAFADDTMPHGASVPGARFPDGQGRYKVRRQGPFGLQQWYQLTVPEE